MKTGIAVIVALLLLTILVFGRLWFQRVSARACSYCFFPKFKCECPPSCKHEARFPSRWSQDGWVAKCRTCGEIVYLGDDFDAGADQ